MKTPIEEAREWIAENRFQGFGVEVKKRLNGRWSSPTVERHLELDTKPMTKTIPILELCIEVINETQLTNYKIRKFN